MKGKESLNCKLFVNEVFMVHFWYSDMPSLQCVKWRENLRQHDDAV